MSEFISKLQYKNYEKGEYSDQKARNLEQTLDLVKLFPWNEQRGTEIQLTGPSVTILDDNGNFLKVGLYFSDKFCLYYFTCDHHLYEYHVKTYDEIATVVTAFFAGNVDLQKFERNRLVIGAVKAFEDSTFCYRVKAWKFYGRFVFLIFLTIFLIGDGLLMLYLTAPMPVKIIFPVFISFMVCLLAYQQYRVFQYYHRCKNMFLELSTGVGTFRFGDNDNVSEYQKSDIVEINIYGSVSGKSTPILTVLELVFKSGFKIKLPGMLIPPLDVRDKFIGVKINQFNRRSEYTKQQFAYARGE